MKKALIAIVILLGLGAGLWYLANNSLNPFIKAQIESLGSQYTGQLVRVKQVDIQLTKGAGSIKGLTISNPEGFKQPNAISLEDITLDINLKSLTKEPIIIDQIKIIDPQAFVEITAQGKTNFNQIIDQINKNLPKSSKDPQPETSTTAEEPKVRVEQLIISGVALSLDLSQLGNKEHKLTLQDIQLSNIGGKDGLPASQLGGEIAKQMLTAIADKAKKEQEQRLKKKALDKIKKVAEEKLGGLLDKLKGN